MPNSDDEVAASVEFRDTYHTALGLLERIFTETQAAAQTSHRLLITLASGSLLASISLLRTLVSADTVWLELLSAAWVLLGLSVFACLVRLGTYNPMGYDMIVAKLKHFIDDAEELTQDLKLSPKDKAIEALKIRMKGIASDPEVTKPDAWLAGAAAVAHYSFFLGLLALIAFSIRNLPWSS